MAVAFVAMFAASCQHDADVTYPTGDATPDGWVEIEFTADAPQMTEVAVRAADPDGIDVHNLVLFCFNDFGLYITHVEAEISPAVGQNPSLSGTYKAVIPEDTRIIHFLGNQNPELFDAQTFVNRSEDEIQDDMVGASGMIIYWSRFIFSNEGSFQQQLANANGGSGIKLIRNQAKISIANPDNQWITISGFVPTNIHAFGTTAPYHPEKRFPTPGTAFEWPGDDFVTLPNNRAKLSDITDVYTKAEEYIFEHENTLQDPVSVILRGLPAGGSEELYYRVMIIDGDGEQLMIRRNHHYNINITGALTYGCKSFEEALVSPATNNVWVAVDDWVSEVSFGSVTLAVDQTSIVLGEDKAGSALDITYTITDTASTPEAASVSWVDGNTVAAHSFTHNFEVSGNTGVGRVAVQLMQLGDKPMLSGTLVIKTGRLQRTVNITLIKTQKFTPVWAATQIYGGNIGELATLKFNVPEDFPFFPFNVYVSVNSLDVRTETTGRVLPVVKKGEDQWYGVDNDLGYKYIYTVTEPGVQRIYFHNVLTHDEGGKDTIMLEAEFFDSVTKEFVYATHQNAISVEGLSEQRVSGVDDEPIYYRLVPRKINAPVKFDILLNDVSGDTPRRINAGPHDEFLLYSRSLDSLRGQADRDMFNLPEGWEWDCSFYRIDDSYWKQSTNGRMLMFKPTKIDKTGDEMGSYTLYLRTNAARSNDMVRIASNQPGSNSAIPSQSHEPYQGNTYRSFIFELATYRPFRFAAQVAINGEEPVGSWNNSDANIDDPDPVDNLVWSYLPNQKVDISFDVTSFVGSDGHSADPFGTAFDIYIDAPMLKIDNSRLTAEMATKLKPHATITGRFVYTVDASRDVERTFGSGEAVKVPDTTAGVSQLGERKSLPFMTTDITSAGEIVISSDMAKVEFFEKRFTVTNDYIRGKIRYNDGGTIRDVAHNEFVSFAIEKTGVRIGSMNIVADGEFSLNLRSEYDFSWSTDAVVVSYVKSGSSAADTRVYTLELASLEELYDMVKRGETLVLEE